MPLRKVNHELQKERRWTHCIPSDAAYNFRLVRQPKVLEVEQLDAVPTGQMYQRSEHKTGNIYLLSPKYRHSFTFSLTVISSNANMVIRRHKRMRQITKLIVEDLQGKAL